MLQGVGAGRPLERVGPQFGYHPKAEKSWGICPLTTEAATRAAFDVESLPVQNCRGRWYGGAFIGSDTMRDRWVERMVAAWVDGVKALAMVAVWYPQAAYAALPCP